MAAKRKLSLSSADYAPDSAPILLKNNICANLEEAASIGYGGLEVHTRETALLDYDKIAKTSSECGVEISAIVTGRLNTQGMVSLSDDRPYITGSAMSCMRSYIAMAHRLKTDLIVGWIRGKIPEGANPGAYMERLAQNLSIICKEASEQGVRIVVEVINRYETNIFNTTKETLDFIDAWDIKNCYVHLDTFHMNIEETDAAAAIRACGEKLGYFHAADNTRCYPGSGTIDFKSCFDALDEIGYTGYISVECFPKPDGKTAAVKALDYLRQF